MSECRVLFFSVLKDAVGQDELTWKFTPPLTVGALFETLAVQFPKLSGWHRGLLMAVDQEYVRAETLIPSGSEVAYMPPVQGG